LLTSRRSGALTSLDAYRCEARCHTGAAGPRNRLGRWIDDVPVGVEALRYAQVDVWYSEGSTRLRAARVAESEGLSLFCVQPGQSVARLAEAAEAYDVASHLFDGALRLLHAISVRHGMA